MKHMWRVAITSRDQHNRDNNWTKIAYVYTKEDDAIGAAFRQINTPSVNTSVWYGRA